METLNVSSETSKLRQVEVWIDGGVRSVRGHGSWAAVLRSCDGNERVMKGVERSPTTHNVMLLNALVQALHPLRKPAHVIVYSAAEYIVNGVNAYLPKWLANGWRRADGGKPENWGQWLTIASAAEHHRLEACWVNGEPLTAVMTERFRAQAR